MLNRKKKLDNEITNRGKGGLFIKYKNMTDYSKISKKLNDENVYFVDEAETYVVVADVTRKQACKAMNLFDKDEFGGDGEIDEDEIECVKFYEIMEGKYKDWIWWGEDRPVKSKFISLGWIYRI